MKKIIVLVLSLPLLFIGSMALASSTIGTNISTEGMLTITGSANSLNLLGSTTGNPFSLTATGSDTDISINLQPKGTGIVLVGPAAGLASSTTRFLGSLQFGIVGDGIDYFPSASMVSAGGTYPAVVFGASNGTLEEPTDSLPDDAVSSIQSFSYIQGDYSIATEINSYFGDGTGLDTPGYISFKATPIGANHVVDQLLIGWHTGSGATDAGYRLWVPEFTTYTNNYYSWFDSRGVRRVREDNTFNGVGQAIETLYNPQFTKYTPGATNYERITLGQWSSNTAQIGTEASGTGTLRPLQLLGSNVGIGTSTPVANFQVATTTVNATTTMEIGKANQNKGSCLKLYRTDGTPVYAYVGAGTTAFTLSTTACATVTSF